MGDLEEETDRALRTEVAARFPTSILLVLAVGWLVALALIALIAVAAHALDRPVGDLTRDPVAVLDGPAYIGVLSNIGAVVWAVGLSACLIAVIVHGFDRWSPFLWGGLLTGLLLADDLFLLHEAYYPSVGIPEKGYPILYAAAFVAYLVVFRGFLASNAGWLLLLAAALFAASALLDLALDEDAPFLIEDGFKLLGIVAWTVLFLMAAIKELRPPTSARMAE